MIPYGPEPAASDAASNTPADGSCTAAQWLSWAVRIRSWLDRALYGPPPTYVSPPLKRPKPTTDEELLPTLELLNAELLGRYERVNANSDRIDNKASVILGVAAVGIGLIYSSTRSLGGLGVSAAVAYLVAAAFAVAVLFLRRVPDVPDERFLTREYADRSHFELLGALVGTRPHTIKKALDENRAKALLWYASLLIFSIGVVLSVVAIIEAGGGSHAGDRGHHRSHGRTHGVRGASPVGTSTVISGGRGRDGAGPRWRLR